MADKQDRIVLGWREWLSLPGLRIPAVKAKVDTGARTSALHAFALETFTERGQKKVRFRIHPLQHVDAIELTCIEDVIDERMVSDSGGHREKRPVICTPVCIAGKEWPVEITLTNREDMLFRMLLGRTAMRGKIVVDPGASFLTGQELAHTYEE